MANHDELARSIDVYMASHDRDGAPLRSGNFSFKSGNRYQKFPKSNENVQTEKSEIKTDLKSEAKPNKEEVMRKGLCFNCYERGHTAKTLKFRQEADAGECLYSHSTSL